MCVSVIVQYGIKRVPTESDRRRKRISRAKLTLAVLRVIDRRARDGRGGKTQTYHWPWHWVSVCMYRYMHNYFSFSIAAITASIWLSRLLCMFCKQKWSYCATALEVIHGYWTSYLVPSRCVHQATERAPHNNSCSANRQAVWWYRYGNC